MIKLENVSKIYGKDCKVLDSVSLIIHPKEFVSLTGPSGAGKSTLLKMLIKEEVPSDGQVFWQNRNLAEMTSTEVTNLRRKIGTVFQDMKLLPNKTAYENIAFAMEVGGRSDQEVKEDVPRILKLVGLAERSDHFPDQLSGGERQRVSIGRALAHRPAVLMADEPTGNLDEANKWEIVRLLVKINELGTTVIFTTHEKKLINELKRRVITMENGQVAQDEQRGSYIL